MSGPKKSYYEIQKEQKERQRRERELKRIQQVQEIKERLDELNLRVGYLVKSYDFDDNMIKDWILEAYSGIDGDLRNVFRQIKGIENYIVQLEGKLKEKEKKQAEKLMFDAKVSVVLSGLESIENDYKEILNDSIKQRVELFKNSIQTNPDNQNTMKQIEQFKSQLHKQYQEYLSQNEDTTYIAEIFSQALSADITKGLNGNLTIQGSIEGVPISVSLNNKNREIDFDTPTNGSCQNGLNALHNKLKAAHIHLGPIKVLKTGQVFNNQKSNNTATKVQA